MAASCAVPRSPASTLWCARSAHAGEAVEGDILKIDPHTLEIELLRRGPRGNDKSVVPSVRFAHSAVAVTCPAGGGGGGPPLLRMVVFGGVNPKEDLNDVAFWADDGMATPPTPAPAAAPKGLAGAAADASMSS